MAIDYDSEALRRILGDLVSDDPEFVRSFEAGTSTERFASRKHPDVSLIWWSVSIGAAILGVAFLMLGSPSGAVLLAAVTGFAGARGFRRIHHERHPGSG